MKETGECGDPLAALDRALADGGNRRSPLKQAMLDDYEGMAARLRGKRPNWRRLTEEFMRAGFRNMDGSDLDPENVRMMWFDVRRTKGDAGRRVPASVKVGVVSKVMPELAERPREAARKVAGDEGDVDDPLAAVRAEMNKRSGR